MKRSFKTQAANLIVALGPAIRSCCYEVGSEFRRYFPDDLLERGGKLYLDLVSYDIPENIPKIEEAKKSIEDLKNIFV